MAKMLHTAFTVSGSVSLPNQRNHTSINRFNHISLPFRSESLIGFHSNGPSSPSICSPCSSSMPSVWILNRSPVVERRSRDSYRVKATVVPESSGENDAPVVEKSRMQETLLLGLLFVLWNVFNIYFNIYNKQVLEVFPYPVTMTAVQFAIGTFIISLTWAFNLHKWPNISRAQLVAVLPLAVMHTLASLTTNMSLGRVSVSFTHTIKAMEPFFTVVLSTMFLGEGLNINEVYFRALLASIGFHGYQQVAYMILQRVSPVTHSVGNCVKRVVIIVISIFFFHTPVSLINSIGTGMVIAGVFLYSQVNRIKRATA
ncbi:hypothetical protein R6Q59_035831 [Mikania micrantha]